LDQFKVVRRLGSLPLDVVASAMHKTLSIP
jgi:hypothetical protein